MRFMEALTKLVVGMSRLGDHLLKQKVAGIIVAALTFTCGAGLGSALKDELTARPAAPALTSCGAPDLTEVSIRDTPARVDEEKEAVFEGRYVNDTYGYSVRIPYRMVGLGARPPAPQHGFGIDLDHLCSTAWTRGTEFPKSYLYVDGSYNSLEWERLEEAVNSQLRFLGEKGRDVSLQSREQTTLGGLPAERFVVHYLEDGVEMVSDQVVAFGTDGYGGASVVHTVALSTPRSKYERDRLVLDRVRLSWCLQPVE